MGEILIILSPCLAAVTGQWSANVTKIKPILSYFIQKFRVSIQPSAVSRQLSITQIKLMLTCCLDAVAHGGNPQDRAASLIQKLLSLLTLCP
ncbi:MAG: hypothetical protein F6J90_19135 [Moorea sp. SIOASIH]|uniref:hypothetical protein n=1 Tax=Moorena sp. SIOASIH TaxID=2607817 RepID=UPI0013BC4612|nr:hypothetical protein [Moorena sp. SIOASIH]NEO38331.1 hypothetical protein [Moorena sp. SIOASIH]